MRLGRGITTATTTQSTKPRRQNTQEATPQVSFIYHHYVPTLVNINYEWKPCTWFDRGYDLILGKSHSRRSFENMRDIIRNRLQSSRRQINVRYVYDLKRCPNTTWFPFRPCFVKYDGTWQQFSVKSSLLIQIRNDLSPFQALMYRQNWCEIGKLPFWFCTNLQNKYLNLHGV